MLFASQCVWAGFGGSNTASEIASKRTMDTTGTNKWWSTASGCESSWSSCSAFRTYVESVAASNTESGIVCDKNIVSCGSTSLVGTAGLTQDDLVGAILHVRGSDSNGDPVKWGHAVVVTDVAGSSRNQVYFTSYNKCRKNAMLGDRFPSNANDETRGIYVIVPRYFRDCNGASENYLYADLQPTLTVGTTKTLCGRAYLANSTLTMTVYKPNGTQYGSTFRATNATAVSGSVTFNTAGLWKVEVGGLGLNTYTFVIRVVSS